MAVTPLSPVRALLARLAIVLATNAALITAIDLVAGQDGLSARWLLPMAAVAMLAAVVASWSTPMAGAVTGIVVWVAIVLSRTTTGGHVADLTSTGGQLVWAAATATLLAVALVRSRTRRMG